MGYSLPLSFLKFYFISLSHLSQQTQTLAFAYIMWSQNSTQILKFCNQRYTKRRKIFSIYLKKAIVVFSSIARGLIDVNQRSVYRGSLSKHRHIIWRKHVKERFCLSKAYFLFNVSLKKSGIQTISIAQLCNDYIFLKY